MNIIFTLSLMFIVSHQLLAMERAPFKAPELVTCYRVSIDEKVLWKATPVKLTFPTHVGCSVVKVRESKKSTRFFYLNVGDMPAIKKKIEEFSAIKPRKNFALAVREYNWSLPTEDFNVERKVVSYKVNVDNFEKVCGRIFCNTILDSHNCNYLW